jgi:5-methylthioadenosine/S-adenosylhomocysteine deaminase
MQWKREESDVRCRQECIAAAHENRKTGVGLIDEHSDRPYAATALLSAGIDGLVFQETITFFERESRQSKLTKVREKARDQAKVWRKPVFLTPHAFHTVDEETLREFGASTEPISIHVAETPLESMLTRDGAGPLADFRRQAGFEVGATGKSIVKTLADLGIARQGAQFVHCCDVDDGDLQVLAKCGVTVAHCPRSNIRLSCPMAPVREMLDIGIPVGLGMDSPASGGPIDMFAEMRAALQTGLRRGRPVTPVEVWNMATNPNALSFAGQIVQVPTLQVGATANLIKIAVPGASCIDEVIQQGSPAKVSWVKT